MRVASLSFTTVVAVLPTVAALGVRNNGENCAGVKSCRPRCLTFQVERSLKDCQSSRGIFTVKSRPNPWNIKDFAIDGCATDLSGDLTIHIGEEGHTGPIFKTTVYLPDGDDMFTFCSVYPCTKGECALPEQMGSNLQFDFIRGFIQDQDPTNTSLLAMNISLTPAFAGNPLQDGVVNRYGPLHVIWMDDPTGCRDGEFPVSTPVAPEEDPVVEPDATSILPTLYCSGPSYTPGPLPQTASPTSMPSAPPSASPAPTVQPTYSSIGVTQGKTLESFYNATEMWSDLSVGSHNWFVDPDYCNFTGVTCNSKGWVTSIDLSSRRLGGSIPDDMEGLSRLRSLKLVNNGIGGPIPTQLADLPQLQLIELSSNSVTGSIPTELSQLGELRRLMLQYNSLTGTIPGKLCDLPYLIAFDISGNTGMYGSIPSCFGTFPLEIFRIDDIGLVGEVPTGLCDVRPINGLYPNVYGCGAIACPAGTYEPTIGRENGSNEGCLDCLIDSNVIGSTSCVVVNNNTVATSVPTSTLQPSSSPSKSPGPSVAASAQPSSTPSLSAVPSAAHSVAPVPTASTPSPTPQPSVAPSTDSEAPTALERDTGHPSTAPSISTPSAAPSSSKSSSRVSVMFSDVASVMNSPAEIDLFVNVTKEYLTEDLEEHWLVEVDVVSQALRVPSGDTALVTVLSRRLEDAADKEEALFVMMKIAAARIESNTMASSSFEDALVTSLEVSGYANALGEQLDLFKQGPKFPEPSEVEESAPLDKKNGRRVNWTLLGASVSLSVLAIGTVFFVRHLRLRDRLRKDQALFDGYGGPGEVGTVSYQPEVQSAMSPPSYQRDAEYAMSEESSGGWNSEDSDDVVNQDPSVAAWSNELCLVSKAPDETLV